MSDPRLIRILAAMRKVCGWRRWGLVAVLVASTCLLGLAQVNAASGSGAHGGTAEAHAAGAAHGINVIEDATLFTQFCFSYLTAYMFFLSICLGSLFLVLIHHLFDAGWSVPIRRLSEQLASLLFPWMAILWLPIGIFAGEIYPWMNMESPDHALMAKGAYLNPVFFYIRALLYFGVWWLLSSRLRYWSLKQDESGAAECTYKMRFYSALGIFLFAFTLTGAAIDWMKSLEHQWFSTMYGVVYFAGSVWLTLGTTYVIAYALEKKGPLRHVMHKRQYHDIGVLMLAFTVFYAYVHFSQYFIIWNANIPEETFWYVRREAGTWWDIGMVLVFGHFFIPFLLLLNQDYKLIPWLMGTVAVLMWGCHYLDMSYNITPILHPENWVLHILDVLCFLLIGAVLAVLAVMKFRASAPYPLRDPRLKEAITTHVIPAPSPISVAPEGTES